MRVPALLPLLLALGGAENVQYLVTLQRNGGAKLGFSFNSKSPVPAITRIVPGGLVDEWNRKHPDRTVQLGDEIIEVNGIRGETSIFLAAFKTSNMIKLKLWRRAYAITLDKSNGSPLGLNLSTELKTVLVITGISSGGLVEKWNIEHPESQVQLGDEIVEVNDLRGDANELYAEFTKDKKLRMRLWRRRLRESASTGKHYFSSKGIKAFEHLYWPRFVELFIVEGDPRYPMPTSDKVPDLLPSLKGVRGLAVHTQPEVTVTEGQGYAMFAAGMRKDIQTLKGLTVAWQAAGQGFADKEACGGCGAKCAGNPYVSCLCKTVPGAYMPGWALPMDEDWKMGSATDGDQDAITGLIYLAELTDSPEFRKYAVRSITAFVLEDIGYANSTANSRQVPVVGDIPERLQKMYLWRSGTCGGGYDMSSNDDNHDLCISPGYFSPGQWRLFQRYLKLHRDFIPSPYTAEELSDVLESAIVWGYNTIKRISCDNGIVSNWWTLPSQGWPYKGKLKCTNSGTQAGAYYSDAARIPWRVVLDYLWFPDAKTPSYDEYGQLDGTFGAKEYANRWSGAWIKLIQNESAFMKMTESASAQLPKDTVLGVLSQLDTCSAVPYGFTALPRNGWGALPVITTFQVPTDGVAPCTTQRWLDYVAKISFDRCVNDQYFDLGQEVIVSSMVGGSAWLPLKRTDFLITLDKVDGSELGLDLDQRGPVMFIKKVNGGLVSKWNKRNPFWKVIPGDEIVAVNDVVWNVSKQVKEIRNQQHLMIKLWRTDPSPISSCKMSGPVPLPSPPSSQTPSPRPAPHTAAAVSTTTSPWWTSTTTSPWWTSTATLARSKATGKSTSTSAPGSSEASKSGLGTPEKSKCAAVNAQCGGQLWKGPTCCQKGCTCKVGGPYYSQCTPPAGKITCNDETMHILYDTGILHTMLPGEEHRHMPPWPVLSAACIAVGLTLLFIALLIAVAYRHRSFSSNEYTLAEAFSPGRGPTPV